MKTIITTTVAKSCTLLGLTFASTPALATSYTTQWLDFSYATTPGSPVVLSGFIADGTTYNLPGYGDVRVNYTSNLADLVIDWNRQQTASKQNGNVSFGPDNAAWTTYQEMSAVGKPRDNEGNSNIQYDITFTFLNGAIPAGELVLGSTGLGRKDIAGEGPARATVVRVAQNGAFLGDWDLPPQTAPTQFTPGAGFFELQNSTPQTSRPDSNGSFNTDLGVTRINDPITSLTLSVNHIDEDGIGFSVGRLVEPPQPPTPPGLQISKFNDLDRDGEWDVGEPAIGDVEFIVDGPGGSVPFRTDLSGSIYLGGLPTGEYTVTEVLPTGWFSTTGISQSVTLNNGEVLSLTFGNIVPEPASLSLLALGAVGALRRRRV